MALTDVKSTDGDNLIRIMEATKFYENIELYHGRVDKISRLIKDYFDHRKSSYNKEYMAMKIIDNKIVESTEDLTNDIKDRIGYWLRNEKYSLEESIYTIEFKNRIFFCKIFDFGEDNIILAGYVLDDTALVRTFISKFSEQRIKEKYEQILAII